MPANEHGTPTYAMIDFEMLAKKYMKEHVGISTTEYRVFEWIKKQPEPITESINGGLSDAEEDDVLGNFIKHHRAARKMKEELDRVKSTMIVNFGENGHCVKGIINESMTAENMFVSIVEMFLDGHEK